MLYLPPGWGHDGVARRRMHHRSIGFRAPRCRASLPPTSSSGSPKRRGDDADSAADGPRYRDAGAPAADRPARIPGVAAALRRRRRSSACSPTAVATSRALGEVLSEPKPRHLVRARGVAALRRRRDRARPPHPDALRRALRLRQRRGVPRRRTRCDTHAPARRPAPARREERRRRERRGARAAGRVAERRLVRGRTERFDEETT